MSPAKLLPLLLPFKDLNYGEIPGAIDALKAFFAADGVKAKVRAFVAFSQEAADITPNETDDRVADTLAKVPTDLLIDVLADVIEKFRPAEGRAVVFASANPDGVIADAADKTGLSRHEVESLLAGYQTLAGYAA